jgi:hypothetical protein
MNFYKVLLIGGKNDAIECSLEVKKLDVNDELQLSFKNVDNAGK